MFSKHILNPRSVFVFSGNSFNAKKSKSVQEIRIFSFFFQILSSAMTFNVFFDNFCDLTQLSCSNSSEFSVTKVIFMLNKGKMIEFSVKNASKSVFS